MHLKNRQFWPIQVSNSSSIMNSEIVTLAQAIASSETQGRLAGARGNKSDKEMKRHRFTSKAGKAPFSALLVNPRRFISLPDLFPLAPANRPWVSEDEAIVTPVEKNFELTGLRSNSRY